MISKHLQKKSFSEYLKWSILSVCAGLLAGFSATLFLTLLQLATETRESNRWLIFLLPLGGFLIGWLYLKHGKGSERGTSLILDEIHDPQKVLPLRMAPFVLLSTLVTHLFGGSAGREGTAVQMGATLSDQLSRIFHIGAEERRILLTAGAGAGFGAAIGAPWAGVVFGMEVIHVGRLRLFALFECLIASHVGYLVTRILHAPHTVYPTILVPKFSFSLITSVLLSGSLFGISAIVFIRATHVVERIQKKFIANEPLRPFLGGLFLVGLFKWEGTSRFTGLGLPVIQEALRAPAHFLDPLLKIFFTAITIGSGFKGGEFIPLVIIGTTLGSALSLVLVGGAGFLGALGFAAVFGAAANTPISCTIMAMEIFGPNIGIYAAISCYTAYYLSFDHRIYSSQKIYKTKFRRLMEYRHLVFVLPIRFLRTTKIRSNDS